MRRKIRKQLPQLIMAGGALALCCVAMVYIAVQSMGQQSTDAYGCYASSYQAQTAVIVDASEPRWNEEQARSLHTYFKQLYDGLAFNERLSVYTTEGDQVASVVAPRFSVCGQATSDDELAQVNAPQASTGYLKNQKQKLFDDVLKPELDQLLSLQPDPSRRQNNESPIMETILAVSRSAKLETDDHLTLISDLVQNSESARFCRAQNDMPQFASFKERRIYQGRLKPRSLAGIEVEALMLIRDGYGQEELSFCASEDELRGFWGDYFEDNGVTDIEFIRIRSGFVGQ